MGLAVASLGCSPPPPSPPTILLAGPPLPSFPSAAPAGASAVPVRPPAQASPIAWETSEPAAREKARRSGRPLLVWVRAEWAVAALEMERTTWSDPRVLAAARPFVALRLDVTEAEGDAERYAERYQVTAMPMTVLLDARGVRVAALVGSQDAAKLAAALQSAAE